MRYWTIFYLLLAVLVVFGGGYPAFAYLRKRGKGLVFLLLVAAVIGGGVLGLYWDQLILHGDGPNNSFKPNPLRGSA